MGLKQSRHSSHTSSYSDDPPFIAQCEEFYEGGPEASDLFDECKKNPGHPTFIPVKDFSPHHLPPECRSRAVWRHVTQCCDRTVRVVVKYTSLSRPDTFPHSKAPYPFCRYRGSSRKTRTGTGFLKSEHVEPITSRYPSKRQSLSCPCARCRDSPDPVRKYHPFVVSTAAHVVFDDSEAERTVFELFYDDDEDRSRVRYLYGVRLLHYPINRCEEDRVAVVCVTHDDEDVRYISDRVTLSTAGNFYLPDSSALIVSVSLHGVIISHPHGKSKHVTIGQFLKTMAPVPNSHSMPHQRYPSCLIEYEFFKTRKSSSKFNPYDYRPMFTFGCRVPEDAPDPPRKLCNMEQKCLALDDYREFKVKSGIKFSIPSCAKFLCQSVPYGDGQYYEFPPGTRVSCKYSNKWFVLPDVEFSLWPGRTWAIYSIDTCAGCSGAPVLWVSNNNSHSNTEVTYLHDPDTVHSGALKDGLNRSALYNYEIHKGATYDESWDPKHNRHGL